MAAKLPTREKEPCLFPSFDTVVNPLHCVLMLQLILARWLIYNINFNSANTNGDYGNCSLNKGVMI